MDGERENRNLAPADKRKSYRIADVHAMLNHHDSANPPSIVYDSALAQKERGVRFRPVRETLADCAG